MGKTEARIEALKEKLLALGPMHPGKISQQWNVCGKENCRCKDRKNPVKHGPYYQLSFSVGKKNSSRFLKENQVAKAQKYVERYNAFKSVLGELTEAYVALAKEQGFQ